jgi:AraC-like DNA-binding protein
VHDLVALVLGATREAANIAQGRGVQAARLTAAKAHIADACSNAALSIGTVAGHIGVTPRYLQSLFGTDGSTFSNYVRCQRLARAHRMLTNPTFESRPVSAIAYAAGFADLSYFNRCFRQRYSATPGDIRKMARK